MLASTVASWQMHVVAAFTRLIYRPKFSTVAGGRRTLARRKGSSTPPKRLHATTSRTHGFDVHTIGAAGRDVVVYLHGGAYTSEIVSQHWSLIAHLARHTGHQVRVPIYGLSPAHDGLEALDFVAKVIADVTGEGRRCYLIGDSSGGGLALLAAQHAAQKPAGLTLMAPWLDLAVANPGIDAIEPHDPWLARPGLRPLAEAWAAGLPLQDPRLSPLFGDLAGLPPLQVLVGTRDITLADCRELRDRLPAGTPLTYHEEPGALHVYPLLPVPEARAGRRMIVEHITRTLTGRPT